MQLHWDTLTPTRRVLADVDVSASDLQVLDLKAAGALSCLCMLGVSHTVSRGIKLAQPCMHHAPYRGCCQASVADTKKSGILQTHAPQRCQTLLDITLHAWQPHNTARAVMRLRLRSRVLTTACGHKCSGSTLGTLELCQQPLPKGLSGLTLVLNEPSMGGEGPVIWNVIRRYTRSGIYVIKKAVGTRST